MRNSEFIKKRNVTKTKPGVSVNRHPNITSGELGAMIFFSRDSEGETRIYPNKDKILAKAHLLEVARYKVGIDEGNDKTY